MEELAARHVDADEERVLALKDAMPARALADAALEHIGPDFARQSRRFRHALEFRQGEAAELGVVPVDEGFHAHQALVGNAHDRLVEHADLAALDGMLEVRAHHSAFVALGAHFRLEQLDAVRARALGAVHRALGFAQKLLGGRLLAVIHRDADAARQHDVAAADLHRRAQGAAHPFGQHGDVTRLGVGGEQDGELQRVHAGERVLLAEMAREAARDGEQDAVIRGEIGRAALVFQGVDLDEEDGGLQFLFLGADERDLEPVEEQLAVRQAREAVLDRVLQQAFLRAARPRDVAHETDAAQVPRVALRRGERAQLIPEVTAIGAAHPEIDIDFAALPLANGPKGEAQPLTVRGVEILQPVLRAASERPVGQAERRFDLPARVDLVAPPVPFPDGGAGGFERHDAEFELPRILADAPAIGGVEGVLRDRECDQRKEYDKPGRQRGDDDIAGKIAENRHGGSEEPDHEQHPRRQERERALLSPQG